MLVTVLYIDNSPLLLSDIKRNANDRIIHGHVVNGAWELRLSDDLLYAFEDLTRYGWSSEMYQHSMLPYTTYEEVLVEGHQDYNVVINNANKIRSIRS